MAKWSHYRNFHAIHEMGAPSRWHIRIDTRCFRRLTPSQCRSPLQMWCAPFIFAVAVQSMHDQNVVINVVAAVGVVAIDRDGCALATRRRLARRRTGDVSGSRRHIHWSGRILTASGRRTAERTTTTEPRQDRAETTDSSETTKINCYLNKAGEKGKSIKTKESENTTSRV